MPQPFLDLFQAYSVGIQQAGAAMAKVVETDFFEAVVLHHQRKMLGDIARLNPFAHLVHIDVLQIVVTLTIRL